MSESRAHTSIMRIAGLVGSILTGVMIASCGGSAPGPSPAPPPGGGTPTPTAASMELSLTRTSIPASESESVGVTVTALDADRQAVADVPIQLSADSGILEPPSGPATGSDGKVTTTFRLGQDRANRVVTINATSGGLTGKSATINVTGSTVQLTASPSLVRNAQEPAQLGVLALDAAGQPQSGVTVTFSTTQGTLAAPSAITGADGRAAGTLTGVVSSASVTASAVGASAVATVQAASQTLPDLKPDGVVIKTLLLQANPSAVGPNAAGASGNSADIQLSVLGDIVVDGVTQSKGVPVVNARAKFRIANNPPLGALGVDTNVNPALTNDAGQTIVAFVPGSATSGTNGVTICASVEGFTPSGGGGLNGCQANEVSVQLTIAQQALFVKISTNNEIEKVDNNLNYRKPFSIAVTDAVGRGVAGVTVTPTLKPIYYYKGPWALVGDFWTRGSMVVAPSDGNPNTPPPTPPDEGEARCVFPPGIDADSPDCEERPREFVADGGVRCENEDLNNNGIVDPGEDRNYDGRLWPGQVASTFMENGGRTDSTGFVVLRVKYGQRFATNATYDIIVSAKVGGSEGVETFRYNLAPATEDVKNKDSPGAFVTAPFGIATYPVQLQEPVTAPDGTILPAGQILQPCQNWN